MLVMFELPAGIIEAVKTVMLAHAGSHNAVARISAARDQALQSPTYQLDLVTMDPDTAIGIEWAVAKCIMSQELRSGQKREQAL